MDDKEFEEVVRRLQQQVNAEARESLGERGFDRWQNPKFCGRMEMPDAQALAKGSCGDAIEMFLKIRDNIVTEVSYLSYGCGSSSVAASYAAELARGRTLEEALSLTGNEVLVAIGTFPREEQHCAFLAAKTLHTAIDNYLATRTS